MKRRDGFVSNSSSSSYVCKLCGEEVCGFDIDLREYEMFICENDHVFCESHADGVELNKESMIKWLQPCGESDYSKELIKRLEAMTSEEWETFKEEDDYDEFANELRYEMPASYCPICQLTAVPDENALEYMLFQYATNKEEIHKEMRAKFKTLKGFEEYMKVNK